jgi:hypothetical protein
MPATPNKLVGPIYLHAFDRNGRSLGRRVALKALNCKANEPAERLEKPVSG